MHYKFIIDKYVCSFGSMFENGMPVAKLQQTRIQSAAPNSTHTHTISGHRSEINRTVENLRNVLDKTAADTGAVRIISA